MLRQSLSHTHSARGRLINLKNYCCPSLELQLRDFDSICDYVHIKQQLSLIIVVAVFSRRCLCTRMRRSVCKAVAATRVRLPLHSAPRPAWAFGQLAFSREEFLFRAAPLCQSDRRHTQHTHHSTYNTQHTTHKTRYDTSKTRHDECVPPFANGRFCMLRCWDAA